jgi:hypothetical protein
MEFYWLAKNIVALSMDDKEEEQAETLDKIRTLETKFIVLCRVSFEINFKVKEWDLDNEDELLDVPCTSSSRGTNANKITIDQEEYEDQVKKQGILGAFGPSKPPSLR